MKKFHYPSISILTISYNPDLEVFHKSLESVKHQNYSGAIEHIVVDGGSNNKSVQIAKKYGCFVFVMSRLRNQGEARRAYALQKAKNDIILWLETDNILESPNSLIKLTQPFIDDPNIVSTYPMHYAYNKHASILERYAALFGTSDPVALYLRKTDREPWFYDEYTKGIILRRTPSYDVVKFSEDTLPTVGDNGFLTRRIILQKAQVSPEKYAHIDIYVDLLKLGFNKFAVIKNTSIEHIVGRNLRDLVKRRMMYAQRYSFSSYLQHRRYLVFNSNSWKDKVNLSKYIFYTLTCIEPIIASIRGFIRIQDNAWFLHIVVCWLFLVYYMKNTYRSIGQLKLHS